MKDENTNRRKVGIDYTINLGTVITIIIAVAGIGFGFMDTIKKDHEWIELVGKPHILATTSSGTRGEKEEILKLIFNSEQERNVLYRELLDSLKHRAK